MRRQSSRRRYLMMFATTGAALVAGCSSDGGSDGDDGSDDDDDEDDGGALDEESEPGDGESPGGTAETVEGSPMFHYDPANTGATTTESGPTGGANERWAVDARGNTGIRVTTSPAVVDGTAYVTGEDGRIHALSTGDGSNEWTADLGSTANNSPAVVDGVVYVTATSTTGELYAFDADDGSERWTTTYYESAAAQQPHSVAVADGTVYLGYRGSTSSQLVAFDAGDGSELWAEGLGTEVTSAPAVAGGTVYVGGADYRLHARDAATGEERWTFETTAQVATPAVRDGVVYVPENTTTAGEDGGYRATDYGQIYAVEDGEERWQFDAGGAILLAPAVTDDAVYVGSVDGSVSRLARDDGSEVWGFETGDAVMSAPVVAGDTVYVGSDDGAVYALDAGDGTERWTFEVGEPVRSTPTAVDGRLYVGGNDGFVRALEE